MGSIHIVWDLPDDLDGNVAHIEEHGVTSDEVEDILHDPASQTTTSRTSGQRITFGYTSEGRYLAVVWEHVDDEPLTAYPITAYEAPEPRRQRRR